MTALVPETATLVTNFIGTGILLTAPSGATASKRPEP